MLPFIDDSEWPIVKITWRESIELAEINELASRLNDIYVRRGPMVTVADISALSLSKTTALHRQRVAEEADKLAANGAFVGEAVVVHNPAVRVLYQGYSWLRRTNTHLVRVFGDTLSAKAWAEQQVRANAITQR